MYFISTHCNLPRRNRPRSPRWRHTCSAAGNSTFCSSGTDGTALTSARIRAELFEKKIWKKRKVNFENLISQVDGRVQTKIQRKLTATLELVFTAVAVFLHVAQQVGRNAFAVRAPEKSSAARHRHHRRSSSAGRCFGGRACSEKKKNQWIRNRVQECTPREPRNDLSSFSLKKITEIADISRRVGRAWEIDGGQRIAKNRPGLAFEKKNKNNNQTCYRTSIHK